MMKQGVYFDLPEEAYHADPCEDASLSAGLIKMLLYQSPYHAWYKHPRLNPDQEEKKSEKFDIGKAAHSLMLRDPKEFVLIDADDWRNKDAKEQRAEAYKLGKIPLLNHQYDEVKEMVDSGRNQLKNHECSNAFVHGRSEVTLIWQEDNGVWCRCRIDHCAANGVDFYDYKTEGQTSNPEALKRVAGNLHWDIIHAFYTRGIEKVLNVENHNYRFVSQEVDKPNLLSVIQLDSEATEIAARKIDKAIALWGECLKLGNWPGYSNKITRIGVPNYYTQAWLEAEYKEMEAEAAA